MYCDLSRWSGSVSSAWANGTGCGTDTAVRRAHPVRVPAGELPGDGGAPVVPDDVRAVDAEGVEQPDDVADEVAHRVRVDARRAGRRGSSRAGPARRPGSRRRPAPATRAATPRRSAGSRAAAATTSPSARAEVDDVEHQVAHGDLHAATLAAAPAAEPRDGSAGARQPGAWSSTCGRRGGRRRRRGRPRPRPARRLPARRRGGGRERAAAAPGRAGGLRRAGRGGRGRPACRCARSSTSTCRPAGGCGASCRWSPTGTAAQVGAAGLAVLRAADDGVAALADGFQLARGDLARRQEAERREVFEALLAGGACGGRVLGRAADLGLDLTAPHAVLVARHRRRPARRGARRCSAGSSGRCRAGTATPSRCCRCSDGQLVCVFAAPDDAAVGAGGATGCSRARRGPAWRGAIGRRARRRRGGAGVLRAGARHPRVRRAARPPAPVVDAGELAVYRVLLRDREAIDELSGPPGAACTAPRRRRAAAGDARRLLRDRGHATETARRLHLSVRAVTYRLQRVAACSARPRRPRRAVRAAGRRPRRPALGWPDVPLELRALPSPGNVGRQAVRPQTRSAGPPADTLKGQPPALPRSSSCSTSRPGPGRPSPPWSSSCSLSTCSPTAAPTSSASRRPRGGAPSGSACRSSSPWSSAPTSAPPPVSSSRPPGCSRRACPSTTCSSSR